MDAMVWFGRLVVVVALCLPVLPAGAAGIPTALIATALGPVEVKGVPKTVAVYDVAAIDTLLHLGITPAGRPQKIFVPELEAKTKGAAPVGTLQDPDLEALSMLGPDLVIIGGRSSPHLDTVRRVAPAIDMTIDGKDLLADAKRRLSAYGLLFNREVEAKAAEVRLDAAVAATRAAVAGRGRALIVMTNGPKLSAYGVGSRFGWLHSELGIPPAVPDLGTALHGEVVSFEFIRKANPDWLIVLDRTAAIGETGASAKATLTNDLVAQTTAGSTGQIVYLPPADTYIAAGGVSATLRVLARLEERFRAAP
ncbi:siderophore ABC transporter substrate-binding protein [Azospirillum soli]|uniref:siderophore ABC transporter substrate-binding protein n=1 Tax=Azospirillum soli TaxID=1304799 RepID=UPI001AEBA414|nr:siderophore ABC transporter substrate-binding protein [Azospirillum soli]MBP2316328.1 iron complex transport system substrate-binding protein [Azospirillum soli]